MEDKWRKFQLFIPLFMLRRAGMALQFPPPFSSAEARPIGEHPAATPAATMPAMTVGAPSAEFNRDRFDFDRARDSGVANGDPKPSSLVGVCGLCIESDLECDGLRDRCIIVSLGC